MNKVFFARDNSYGNENSTGFIGTMFVRGFSSKAKRDAWVSEHEDENMSICKITAKRAREYGEYIVMD